MRGSALLMVAVVMLLATGSLAALPAPMSEKELLEKSDFVGSVKVLGVACTGMEAAANMEQVLVWEAWLQVESVKKGSVKPRETILVRWRDVPRKLIGPWTVPYFPGEVVSTHLEWDAKTRTFRTTWWNAKGEPTRPAKEKKLPQQPGEVLLGGS